MSIKPFEPIDKANIQKFVDLFSQRFSRLDFDEEQLEKKLLDFTDYMAKRDTDKEIEDNNYTSPPQFRLENHRRFKEFSIPISRAMWSVPKVVMKMRTTLYEYEAGRSTILPPEIPIQQPIIVNTGPPEKSLKEKITEPLKRIIRDPNSPHTQMQEFINNIQIIPSKWHNILFWYEIGIRKRNQINSYNSLVKIVDDITMVFNAYIESNLVMVIHLASEFTKTETEEIAGQVLNAYIKAQQQSAGRFQGLPPIS